MELQGRTANKQGKTLENVIISTLEQKGFPLVTYKNWSKDPNKYGDEILLYNIPYETIYGHIGRTEFKIHSKKYGEYRIECKWQQTPGSVDEKFPYLYLNCIEKMPEKNIIIVFGGSGAKPGAIRWLKSASNKNLYMNPDGQKDIKIMSLEEFVIWANRTFRD